MVAGLMASRLLRGAGALAAQALSARGPRGVSEVRPMASGGGVPTDAEQATGLEREVVPPARKGLDPYHTLAPKAASGTKEDPNLVRFITRKRMAGCICEEDSGACTKARPGEALAVEPIASGCPTSWPTGPLH